MRCRGPSSLARPAVDFQERRPLSHHITLTIGYGRARRPSVHRFSGIPRESRIFGKISRRSPLGVMRAGNFKH
jgi:hypothetical protein